MFSKRSPQTVKHTQRIARLSKKAIAVVAVSLSGFRVLCAVILIYAGATLELGAQGPAVAPQDPFVETATCNANAVHSKPAKPGAPDDIETNTKAALAAEWDDPDETKYVLNAFQLLTSGSLAADLDCRVLDELRLGSHENPHQKDLCKVVRNDPGSQGLYRVAIGDPDDSGQPTLQGMPSFVDVLAKANKLNLEAPGDEDNLFACTKDLIQIIFTHESSLAPSLAELKKNQTSSEKVQGLVVLARINGYFSGKMNYVALYLLLDAYPKPDKSNTDQERCIYADNLGKLRAAFEMNTGKLATQVAAKISAQKQ